MSLPYQISQTNLDTHTHNVTPYPNQYSAIVLYYHHEHKAMEEEEEEEDDDDDDDALDMDVDIVPLIFLPFPSLAFPSPLSLPLLPFPFLSPRSLHFL